MEVPVRLHTLLAQVEPALDLAAIPNVELSSITEDSRNVVPGALFVARRGLTRDGADYIADAQRRGAPIVVTHRRVEGVSIPQIVIESPAALSRLAQAYYGWPGRSLPVLGITGTNGKTTTAYLVRHVLNKLSMRCGLIGTVQTDDGRCTAEAQMTTPDAVPVAALLSAMRDNACRACAMEVSSHALDQERVAGIRFAGAGFTNLTGDHLDYHKTMDAYAGAKARLFASMDDEGVAVVNADSPYHQRMIRDCHARVVRFTMSKDIPADYAARDIALTASGSNFILHTPDGQSEVRMQLIGRHNIENALCAAGLMGEVMGLSVHQLAWGLADATGAPGRLQQVRAGQPFAVLVDYAHTDDALENVLSALKPLTRRRLRVMFGCGGDRDALKRPRMARVAEKLADVVYVTSDNPRSEQPAAIIDQILAGFTVSGRGQVVVEVDRRRCIERILTDADEGDVVLLAGKGHENYQIVGTARHHFDDMEEATRVLQPLFRPGAV
jgi:UDP-N-acetylmuramoyl-L-alanyl-D-glutamate--2,6-diaminopimelate ligase